MTTLRTFVTSAAMVATLCASSPAGAQTALTAAPAAEVPPAPATPETTEPTLLTTNTTLSSDVIAIRTTPHATFYEVSENMKMASGRLQASRVAVAALVGKATLGTPFCPSALAQAYNPKAIHCDATALGADRVNYQTGLGNFKARISIVVQGDNPVDAPELVVDRVKVSGQMDFSASLINGLPYGTITGSVNGQRDDVATTDPRFKGVFRLPFLASPEIRDILCPLTPNPNPHFPGWDVAYVDTTEAGVMTGRCIDVLPRELSLGTPTVRFDIWFQ